MSHQMALLELLWMTVSSNHLLVSGSLDRASRHRPYFHHPINHLESKYAVKLTYHAHYPSGYLWKYLEYRLQVPLSSLRGPQA